jgi:hypothetical protein
MSSTTCHAVGFLTFPVECVRCGREPRGIVTIEAARRVDLIFLAHDSRCEITVPVCRRCGVIRRLGGFLVGLTLLAGGIGLGFYVLEVAPAAVRSWYVAGFLAFFVALILYIRNWHSRWMDRLMLGISAGRLQQDGTFSLWIRRNGLIPRLSYQAEPRKYVQTATYATQQERAQKQLAAWWGKCLLGLVVMLAAYWVWRDLTQLELGLVRQVSLPSVLVFLYELAGKWTVTSVLAVPGIALFAWGLRQFVRERVAL